MSITQEKLVVITMYGLFGLNMVLATRSQFILGLMLGTFTALSIIVLMD
jgi:hypothetical protein